jgi:UDP-glucose 4-epimerase
MIATVVGGSGFIGSHLVDRLLADGWQVRVLDLAYDKFLGQREGVDYYIGSFLDSPILAKAIHRADVVFHLATTTIPGVSDKDPEFDVATNLNGSLRLLNAASQGSVGKVVFLSSGGTVYGKQVATPIPETHPQNPNCSYGIVKLAIEKYLALFHSLHGLEYTIVRPANPYGPRQSLDRGQGVIPIFTNLILKGDSIEIWGDGSIVRDFLTVEDLVDGVVKAASYAGDERIFNLGSGCGATLNEVIHAIASATGRPAHVRYLAPRKIDVPIVVLDITRAKECLGWQPSVSLEQGIADLVRGWPKECLIVGGESAD